MLYNVISLLACILLLLALVNSSTGLKNKHNHHQKENTDLSGDIIKRKICIGTNGRMSVPSNREHHYRNLRDRYTNCTFVDGNLELTWLQDKDLDLSFLQYIREVTGYVLISHVDVRRIVLPRLQIIRGRTLFKINVRDEEFALITTFCEAFSLELPALRDILNGSVGAFNNFNLCHLNTINWEELISDPKGEFVTLYNFTAAERICPHCDKSCKAGCWGEGPENCQKFSKITCSPQCWPGRCYGSNPRECCSLFCAGGCTGPTQNHCLACKNFNDDGLCTQSCLPMHTYNIITLVWETNPNGKYAYGATCVKNCPEHLLKDSGACVRSCPPEKTAVNGKCVPCDGPCPKTCPGVRPLESVHSGNIEDFRNCTVIDGSLEILDQSFKGFQQVFTNFSFGQRYSKMHPDRLEVFSTLKEVTGYINIQGYHEDFTNLSYFRNLEVIGGRQLMDNFFASLYIVKTSLKSLEMRSLKKINSGAVVILENKNLCYAQDIAWDKITKLTEHRSLLQNNKNRTECRIEGLVCDPQCSSEGCWGAGSDQCLSCQNYQYEDTCIESCEVYPGMYKAGHETCKRCHEECDSACHGPGQEHCAKCKHARDGNFCVPKCPINKYMSENGDCSNCHENCVDGCVGPNNTIGLGGCNSCEKAIINCDVTVERCLQKNESCPDGYYFEWVGPQEQGPLKPLAGKAICRKCHPRCKKCTGYGFHEQVCQECMKFKRGEQCEDECPSDHYADEETQICVPCHLECRGCMGPDVSNCMKCRNFKIFVNGEPSPDNTTAFNCTTSCPPDLPHKIFPNDVTIEPYCSATSFGLLQLTEASTTSPVLIAVIPLVLIVCLVILSAFGYTLYKRAKANKEALKLKMTLALTGHEDYVEPSDVKPNLSKLRIIKEVELRQGEMLGCGAFGKVFKGVWLPGATNVKIPVAIKVLREEMGASKSKDFLDETYIMASVSHPNLLKLLAVCMTNEMMIITQLMPLGCLLDYVRIHNEKIGSNILLNWITQIARGMSHLEKMRLVHRDLAARNVLVQSHNCVKITDFGLAKLLDTNEDVYKAAGGKMPIKWLALECIQHRIFTHKSDVWAFGVTIWEILTYGARPYHTIPAREVPELIENGLKLPQPSICTLDIYCVLVSCWMLDAGSRPSFVQLAATFAEMAKDPGRYLVIPGDKYMKQPTETVTEEMDEIRTYSLDPEIQEIDNMQPMYNQKPGISMSTGAISQDNQNSINKPCSSQSWCNRYISSMKNINAIQMDEMPGHTSEWDKSLPMYSQNTNGDLRHYCNSCVLPPEASGSRYCTDQINIKDQEDSGTDEYKSKVNEAQVGNIKLDLPLDEDDYLMPSSQQNSGASAYMDLIGDAANNQQAINSHEIYPKYPDFNAMKIGVDNPEYLFPTKNMAEITGLPKTRDVIMMDRVHSSTSTTPTTPNGTIPATFIGQRPLEDESISDHEYYNDLQRELQPLRRNETTV